MCWLLGTSNVHAMPNWGTATEVWWDNFNLPFGQGQEQDYAIKGGSGRPTTAIALDSPPGFSRAFAQLQGNGIFPTLKVESFTDANTPSGFGTVANTWALEEFQYSGDAPTILTYNVEMGGLVEEGPGGGGAALFSTTSFYESAGFEISGVLWPSGTIKGDATPLSLSITSNDNPGQHTLTGSLSINVVPGEIFYLFQQFGTETVGDAAVANGFGTLLGHFTDSTNIVALSVPEPSGNTLAVVFLMQTLVARFRMAKAAQSGIT